MPRARLGTYTVRVICNAFTTDNNPLAYTRLCRSGGITLAVEQVPVFSMENSAAKHKAQSLIKPGIMRLFIKPSTEVISIAATE
jgi:hypothetical protein